MKPAQLSMEMALGARVRSYEEQSHERGFTAVAGVDEVGRGPLAGPVIAAAVILPPGYDNSGIRDSKLLGPKERDRLAGVIERKASAWALGIVDAEEIDRLNILQASLLAMVKALAGLQKSADCVLIDGDQTIPLRLFRLGDYPAGARVHQKAIIKGDQRSISIAAASILAKVARDRIMARLDEAYPGYGFAQHKGYSCVAHFDALRRFGASPVHRRSFKPVRAVAAEESLGPLFE
ncbi:MAG TPA: ribonuclease HII [Candidatus Binatia bacterium]|nr:ribonuclease HII [Candidatus Binatia bacterium]